MVELRVYDILQYSFSFLIGEIRTILRLTWPPMVLLFILNLIFYNLPFEQADPLEVSEFFSLYNALEIVAIFLYAMIAVALHRLILFDDRQDGRSFVVQFGRVEWLFVIIGILVYVAYLLAVSFFVSFVPWLTGQPLNVFSLLFLLLVAALMLRFVIIYPDTVARNRIDLVRVLELTKGNSYKIILIMLIGIIIIYISTLLSEFVVAIFDASLVRIVEPAVNTFVEVVDYALMVGLACYSYKMLIGVGAQQYLQQRP